MTSLRQRQSRGVPVFWRFGVALACLGGVLAQTPSAPAPSSVSPPPSTNAVLIVSLEGPTGAAQVLRAGATVWESAQANQVLQPGDRIRSGEHARATLRWSDNSTLRLAPFSHLLVEAPPEVRVHGFNLLKGLAYFFHRDKPTEARFRTRTASAAIRGTEFAFEFNDAEDRTVLTVIDGEIELSTAEGQLVLVRGEQGVAEPGQALRKAAVIDTVSIIQWCLYYPGVLDLDELALDDATTEVLADSLAAYRAGDLPEALARYPGNRQPRSAEEQVYAAALRLAAGEVEAAEQILASVAAQADSESPSTKLASALRTLIAAVKLQPSSAPSRPTPHTSPATASESLADSYWHQARWDLDQALAAARQATAKSPRFGFAWARVAELEFSFGRTSEALAALEKAWALVPRHAPSAALKGFLLSAQNQTTEAQQWFDKAIALDGSFGHGWLGRGLCQIRRGRVEEGRDDLQVAVTVEPQRSLFRSYLAKSYALARQPSLAAKEIRLAQQRDPSDPTAWLYSALLAQEGNRVNAAVRDLEHSTALNDNRRVYRSRFLLDQDQSVRGANLAALYRDAGMFDLSVREAGRAVSGDYANSSAHLFLADSYYQMLDPRQHDQRYETARVSEYLISTLLAPVGAGVLSQPVSAQEYSRLFEQDGLGLYSNTEYLSRGAWQEYAVQHGRFGNSSYALDGYYRTDPGQRSNNDLEQRQLSVQFKQQLSPTDLVYGQAVLADADYGDLAQVYDPTQDGNRVVRHDETQTPLLWLGYHHEWGPGSRTLLLTGYLEDTLRVTNPQQNTLVLGRNAGGQVTATLPYVTDQEYRGDQALWTFDAQQILERNWLTLIGGGRFQAGAFDTANRQTIIEYTNAAGSVLRPAWFENPPQDFEVDSKRATVYGYAQGQVFDPIEIVVGVSYDWLEYPANFRYAPLSDATESTDLVSPKVGLIWTPFKATTVRAAYSRSLGGVSLDQSAQLEPTQVAGFNQAWRSIIPESVAGANAAAEFESWDLSLEHKFSTQTYVAVSGEVLNSDVDRVVGVFDRTPPQLGVFPLPPFIYPSGTNERLDYQERSLTFTVNQLAGENWAFGARYRLSQAELQSAFPEIPGAAPTYGGFAAERDWTATLHQVRLYAIFNHRSGFFASADSLWCAQDNDGYTPSLPGDEFWQFNLFAGYRFPRRQAELRLGLLNLTDQNYRLNPLNLIAELPRERTLAVSFKFSF